MMINDDIIVLSASDVDTVLCGCEADLVEVTRQAYLAHAAGSSSLPQSTFLRFPDDDRNRIIALPAFLGDGFNVAGIKWISSYPSNIHRGVERASGIVVLNSMETGRPEVVLEGSLISAKRTAASAALAAQFLSDGEVNELGLVGCGVINSEILRFVAAIWPTVSRVRLFDLDRRRAEEFVERLQIVHPAIRFEVVGAIGEITREFRLISLATTALKPHILSDPGFLPGTTILHVSLRDLGAKIILQSNNIVDDVDHVCRASTSIHLAAQEAGHQDFVDATLAEIMSGSKPQVDRGRTTIFSPFGLGILDLAVADYVRRRAIEHRLGVRIQGFHPVSSASMSTIC